MAGEDGGEERVITSSDGGLLGRVAARGWHAILSAEVVIFLRFILNN